MTSDGDLVDDRPPPEQGDGSTDGSARTRPAAGPEPVRLRNLLPADEDGAASAEPARPPLPTADEPVDTPPPPLPTADEPVDPPPPVSPPVEAPPVVAAGDDDGGEGGDGEADRDEGEEKPRSATRTIVEWIAVVVGALVVATIIKTFLFQAFWIPSDSMKPTLQVEDRVLVNKLSYDLHDVHRGDVIVFERPPGETQAIKDLIKRVVAVEGDTLTLENGKVLVNGERIDEPYLPEGAQTLNICTFTGTVKVPEDHVFVMGDNRENSKDSRCFGPISEDLIVGRAFVRVWPLNALGGL